MKNHNFIIVGLASFFIVACDSGPIIPKGEESKFLFAMKSSQTLGDVTGNLALNADGIHIHPGATTPTSVSFNLNGKIKTITYKPYIAKLDENGIKIPEAGIVGFEVVVDGKSMGKQQVDRTTNVEKTLDLDGVKTLVFQADNGNGTPAWDWLEVQVISIK
jgi:hypothetical protein